MEDVDFGTYHHSTPQQSDEMRVRAREEFVSILSQLYPHDSRLSILDAGCGLGFLSYTVAQCLPNARITGVDTFDDDSLSGATLQGARANMERLGIESRVSFLVHDLKRPLGSVMKYDLAVSNLVFHNLGRKRFDGYASVLNALKPDGHFVIGDLFPKVKADMAYLLESCTLIGETGDKGAGKWSYQVKVFKKN